MCLSLCVRKAHFSTDDYVHFKARRMHQLSDYLSDHDHSVTTGIAFLNVYLTTFFFTVPPLKK